MRTCSDESGSTGDQQGERSDNRSADGRTGSSVASGSVEGLGDPLTVRVEGVVPQVAIRHVRQEASELTRTVEAGIEVLSTATDLVENVHVARLVERALAYEERTEGSIDVRERSGRVTASVERDGRDPVPFDHPDRPEAGIAAAAVPVDFSALAPAYVLDRIAATLARIDRTGCVTGEGLASRARGTRIVGPRGGTYCRLASDWSLATTANDADADRIRLADGDVLVLAGRDCTEAAALADLIGDASSAWARHAVDDWDGVVALVVNGGVVRPTAGFDAHRE